MNPRAKEGAPRARAAGTDDGMKAVIAEQSIDWDPREEERHKCWFRSVMLRKEGEGKAKRGEEVYP